MEPKKCGHCKKEFKKNPEFSYEKYEKQKFCSRVCGLYSRKGEKRPNASGANHPHWKGGKRTSAWGYILLSRPNHPYAQSHGYILEHRLVMENHLGRYLHPKEVIHHINGDKIDNRIENLELLKSQSEHTKRHFKQDPKTGRLVT